MTRKLLIAACCLLPVLAVATVDQGMRIWYDDQNVKNLDWNQSKLKGFVSVVPFGDGTDGKQTLRLARNL